MIVNNFQHIKKMPYILIQLMLFLSPLIGTADTNYTNIDRYARFTPNEFKRSIEILTRYLMDGAENDEQKVRAFYVWIAENITYDIQSYLRHQYPDQSPEAVFARGTAVCSGYANLFKKFCDIAEIPAITISGFSKGYGYNPSYIPDEPNHMWNAVLVDDQWRLIDVTWASGYIDGHRNFVKRFSGYYFFTDPDEFIFTHFPQNHQYQLLLIPKTREEFLSQMLRSSEWFEYGLKAQNYKKFNIITQNPLTVIIKSPPNVLLTAKLIQDGNELKNRYTFVQKRDSLNEISIILPSSDIFILRIFAKFESDSGLYKSAGEYRIDMRGKGNKAVFPMPYKDFYSRNCYLFDPIKSALTWNKNAAIEIMAPRAEKTALVKNNRWIYFERSADGIFKGTIPDPDFETVIYGLFPGDTKFSALLKFSVQ